jgi:hypothetical protein
VIPPELRDGPSWRQNPRFRLSCECGSERPAIWLIEVGDRKRNACYACKRRVWFEELDAWELALHAARSQR